MFGSRERLYNSWVRDHYRFLFRSAWALTGSRAIAEEVVQDCYELAWRCMDQLRDRSLARPWLFQILRREALRNLAPRDAPIAESYDEAEDPRAAPDAVSAVEQRLDILAALQALAPIHREVLTLYYFEDMPVAEMAVALDVAPGTVLSRLSRARDLLRRRMSPEPASPAEREPATAQVLDFRPATARSVGED
jgi:RNA polymerase sigma factor (sigma-70 family)